MSWFWRGLRKKVDRAVDQAVDDAVTRACRKFADERLPGLVDEVIGTNLPDKAPRTRTQFAFRIAQHLRASGAPSEQALRLGGATLEEFLQEEGIQFGDARYAWDGHAAVTVANEYEVDHWEARS